jgi:hypothetical protein
LTVRDIGAVMGVSFQRAQQVLALAHQPETEEAAPG